MKKILIFTVSLLFAFSCDSNDDATQGQLISGRWNLTKINSSFAGSITPDANNTHYYQINNDGTFKRTAIENSTSEELEGTYIVSDESDYFENEDGSIQKFIELLYDADVTFFSCGILENNKQLLILTSDNKLENNLSGACDGEDYEYTKED